MVSKAGDVLRLLTNVVEPMRKEGTSAHQVDQPVQDKLLRAIHDRLVVILRTLSTGQSSNQQNTAQAIQAVVFLSRLLQFDLGLSGVWTPEMKNMSEPLCDILFRLALVGPNTWFSYVVFS